MRRCRYLIDRSLYSRIISLVLGLLLSLVLTPSPSLAEPIGGWATYTDIADNGRFIIGSYSGPYVAIWDTDRLWNYIQPTQVHAFRGSASVSTGAMQIAAAQGAPWLAYVDDDPATVHVCALKPDFPCRTPIPLDDRVLSLALAPDGSRLMVLTRTELLTADFSRETHLLRQAHPGWRYLKADWSQDRIIVWERDNSLSILKLEDLTKKETVGTTNGPPQAAYLTGDGQHLIVIQETRNSETSAFEEEVLRYPLVSRPSPSPQQVEVEVADYPVPGDSVQKLWYVTKRTNDDWDLTPVGPAGEPLTEQTISLNLVTGNDSRIIAVNEQRGYILIRDSYVSYYIVDLETRLPIFEIYNSTVKYWRLDGELPHLTPKLGAAPLYRMLDRLGHEIVWDSDSGYHFSAKRTETLLRTAALVTRLQDRYDPVWFSLMHTFRLRRDSDESYLHLSELTAVLLQLNRAEHFLHADNADAALAISREALRTVRQQRESLATRPQLDSQEPTVPGLVSNYWPVLERDLWLVLARSFAAKGRAWEAELAYRKVLEDQPLEWRAYDGLLQLYLEADDATFWAMVTEAQTALRMHGWTDRPNLGFPPQFFDETTLQGFRSSQAAEP